MIKHKDLGLPHTAPSRRFRHALYISVLVLGAALWSFRHLLYVFWTLASLNARWPIQAQEFIVSEARDGFDVTFDEYDIHQLSAAPHQDVVPPILHHIALGKNGDHWRQEWNETVQACLDMHPGWQSYIWTDDAASDFVATRFPGVKDAWDRYPYQVQRIDALRYMVLYEYGGVILDMDLSCRRALGPLRRFSFVAPAANPTGFSIGFMMASPHNDFVGDIVASLPEYNRQWLGLPYPTVMFSTGCHFASVIHVKQHSRRDLKVLPGPMHSLNGRVTTPLFDHLGSSSWHSYDARLVKRLKVKPILVFLALVSIVLGISARRRLFRGVFSRRYKVMK